MKLIGYILIVLFFASCAATSTDENVTEKEKQLKEYKQQLHELKKKVVELEEELNDGKEEEVVGVKVKELAARTFEHFIEVTGTVEADLDIMVSPEAGGNIVSIDVTEGQWVKKGQVLGRLNTDAIQRGIEELEIGLELAATTFNRQQKLWDQKIGSEIEYLQAKSNKETLDRKLDGLKAQLDMAIIKSPVDGVVDVIYQKKGEISGPQTPFARVMNINNVKVYGEVSEIYLNSVKKNDVVQVQFPAINLVKEAPVFRTGNVIDPNNRTFKVRVNLSNRDQQIKPNLVSVVKIRDFVAEDAIVIPALLIKDDFRGSYTFVAEKKGDKYVAKKVYVKKGRSDNNMTMVLEGLAPGQKIITDGYEQVITGTAIELM